MQDCLAIVQASVEYHESTQTMEFDNSRITHIDQASQSTGEAESTNREGSIIRCFSFTERNDDCR